ncbi:MAG: sulfatase, partial [Acidobacteriota bacterium]
MTEWRRYRKKIAIILLGAATFIIAAISFSPFRKHQLEAGAFSNFNVLLITLDTTRRDHLPMYGYRGVKTPNLDHLAASSYVFEDAVSHAPLTLPAHTSILTGMLPPAHGVRDNTGFFVDSELLTLPEILKSEGYNTAAFVSAFVLDSRWQLNQGFDVYHDYFSLEEFNQLTSQDAQRSAEETGLEAIQWLRDQKERPFFSWVHFYDPHDPYDPPEPYKTDYSSRPYDGEIAYMDASIGKLLDAVSSSALKDRTIIIVTADHGEGLGQHQEDTHAIFVYGTTQRVPLLIHVPGARANRVSDLVRHVDLSPTILDLLGIETNHQMQGSSLIPMMNGSRDAKRSAYMESIYADLHFGWSPVRSLVTSRFKY